MYKQLGRRFWGYTYEEMEKDLEIFARAFPETMELRTLGKTADKREIYCFILGRADAGERIFLSGAIHGREYMTSQLLMEQTAEFLTKLYREETYKGYSYKELLRGKAVYVAPMANPDGVTISQQGPRGLRNPELQKLVWKIGEREGGRMPCGPYYRRWKANARGVDLNRNFPAFWEEYQDLKGQPSREGYKGRAPEDQEESKALAELTRQEKFQRTVSYHSSGEVIYWDFGQKGEFRKICRSFGERIQRITGYGLPEGWDYLDPAGYKDWAVKERKIPSLTIEIGKAESPLPPSAFREILRRNRGVWEETLLSL